MPRSPHERALLAAVRLALAGTALHGCRAKTSSLPTEASHPPAEADAGRGPTDSAADAEPAASNTKPGSAPATRARRQARRLTPAQCDAELDAFFVEPVPFNTSPPRKIHDQTVATCCAEALATRGGGKHRWSCCFSEPAPGILVDPALTKAADDQLTCTPWGPPAPPPIEVAHVVKRSGHSGELNLRSRAQACRPELPRDPKLDGLRPAAIGTWRERMVNEYTSARVFEGLAEQLEGIGFDVEARECRRFAAQERRHGVQCGAVVEALGAPAIAPIGELAPYPTHADAASELEATVRNVVSICCMSETVAVALISAERWQMPAGSLRELLSEILADEVAHARFGWRLLDALAPSLSAEARARIDRYIQVAMAHLVEHELSHLRVDWVPPPEGTAYGLCDGREARRLFADVVRDAVVPGLRARGFNAMAMAA